MSQFSNLNTACVVHTHPGDSYLQQDDTTDVPETAQPPAQAPAAAPMCRESIDLTPVATRKVSTSTPIHTVHGDCYGQADDEVSSTTVIHTANGDSYGQADG